VIRTVSDQIGGAILSGADLTVVARDLHADVDVALTDASSDFRAMLTRSAAPHEQALDPA